MISIYYFLIHNKKDNDFFNMWGDSIAACMVTGTCEAYLCAVIIKALVL